MCTISSLGQDTILIQEAGSFNRFSPCCNILYREMNSYGFSFLISFQCREIGLECHDEVIKVLNELYSVSIVFVHDTSSSQSPYRTRH